MKDKKVRAIGYIRASSSKLKVKDLSPEEQEEQIKVYAEAEGFELVKTYREKVLGSNIVNQDELNGIYKDVSEGNADIILVYKGDKITKRWSINRLNKKEELE